jgi:DNA polymerase
MTPQEEQILLPPAAVLADLVRAGVTDVVGENPFAWQQPSAGTKPAAAEMPQPNPSTKVAAKLWLTGTPAQLLILTGALEKDEGASPFTQKEEQLLTNMLASIAVDRSHVGILAVAVADKHGTAFAQEVKEKLVTPVQQEIKKLTSPALLALGQVAAWFATGQDQPLGDARDQAQAGAFAQPQALGITYHPRTLLKQPLLKRLAWQDLLAFQAQWEAAA